MMFDVSKWYRGRCKMAEKKDGDGSFQTNTANQADDYQIHTPFKDKNNVMKTKTYCRTITVTTMF